MNHERFDELKDAYVLGALPEEERREFEEYLTSHPERQAEIDELGAVAGLLALSAPEQEPPPELRRSIMAAVEAEAESPHTESRPSFAKIRELLTPRNLALGAAALLVIGLFSWNLILLEETRELQSRVQNDSRMIALEGPGTAHGARAKVVVLQDDQAILMAENMPPLPEDKTFQIWVIENDVPKPGGLFEAREESVATVVEKPVHKGDIVAVTVEPKGGSPKPTRKPMLTAKL